MNTHFARLSVTITNLDGADDEIDDITETIKSALSDDGYEASVSVDRHAPHPNTQQNEQPTADQIPPPAVGCEHWRQEHRADLCPIPTCGRCRHLGKL